MGLFDIFKKKSITPHTLQKRKNGNNNTESAQHKTFICTTCRQTLPIKYMHMDNVCVSCSTKPLSSYIPKKQENNTMSASQTNDDNLTDKHSEKYSCSCCGAEVQKEQIQWSYRQGLCQNCYENFQKISNAIQSNIDPYTVVTEVQKEARNRVAKGVLVDDVMYVKCSMQTERFIKLYYRQLNIYEGDNDTAVYLFNYDEETKIYFEKKCGIPYMQFWPDSPYGYTQSTYRHPSLKMPISFFELELLAKETSTELYKKYKSIDEYNWKEYI